METWEHCRPKRQEATTSPAKDAERYAADQVVRNFPKLGGYTRFSGAHAAEMRAADTQAVRRELQNCSDAGTEDHKATLGLKKPKR